MGIMHKLLKHRDIKQQTLIMDLTKFKDTRNDLVTTAQNSDIAEVDLVPKLATEDNQFTAEHIMQLCKFLAEKSKRNKITQKRLLSNPNKCEHITQSQRESNMSLELATPLSAHSHSVTSTLDSNEQKTNVLTNKLLNNSNSIENIQTSNSMDLNKFQSAQGKRDILLKIRHQIFERKRQRQFEEQQLDVWRPW